MWNFDETIPPGRVQPGQRPTAIEAAARATAEPVALAWAQARAAALSVALLLVNGSRGRTLARRDGFSAPTTGARRSRQLQFGARCRNTARRGAKWRPREPGNP
jgi:hypothetical protein